MSLAFILVIMGFIIEGLIIITSDKIADTLKRKPIVAKAIDKIFGTVLVGLGVKLLFEKNK